MSDVSIINYGMGNLASVANAFRRLGATSEIVSSEKEIKRANRIILPGVGSFADAMENLRKLDIVETLSEQILVNKKPFLGICLGMQLISSFSEEGNVKGINWINANVIKMKSKHSEIRIPHMGWNELNIFNNNGVLRDIECENNFYFVHSYKVDCKIDHIVSATTTHGDVEIIAVIESENVIATQFHPEKSHYAGLSILKNFLNL